VVEHHIQNHAQATPARLGQKGLEIVQRTVFRRDARVIRHIVAAIGLRGGEVRREPQRIDA